MKRRGAVDKFGNRSRRDKRGHVYWIDKAGRRTKRGTPQRATQPRDEFGRLESRDPEKRKPGKLPPFRDDKGRFRRHPIYRVADAVRKQAKLGAGDVDVFYGGDVQTYRSGSKKGQRMDTRLTLTPEAAAIAGRAAGIVTSAQQWIDLLKEHADTYNVDEREFWAIYDHLYG